MTFILHSSLFACSESESDYKSTTHRFTSLCLLLWTPHPELQVYCACFRIVMLCQENPEGINDDIIKRALPDSSSIQWVTALNALLKAVSLLSFLALLLLIYSA